ncbi:MAG: DUF2339 domain-containing protein [Rhizobiaceae bacterium]|nr:DUF2339 domain-containing protein [Rhizobiaceae bacterium]
MLELFFVAAIIVLGIAAWRQNDRMLRLERELDAVRHDYLTSTRAAPGTAGEGAAAVAADVAPGAQPAAATDAAPAAALEAVEAREQAKREAMAKAAAMLDEQERLARTGAAETAPVEAPTQPANASSGTQDIETALGTRWAVWVGGLALALGGVFLIRYTIEAGFFGPAARLTLAGLMGLVLAGGGEFLRRSGFVIPVEGMKNAYVPAILTAVGAFMLFGTVYAAYGVYAFIGPSTAFLLLGVIALATIAAALLHGQALAGMGLLGAYLTPGLVSTEAPNIWALFVYVAVVLVASAAIARLRDWALLMGGALVGAGLWALLYLANAGTAVAQPFDYWAILFVGAAMIGTTAFLWLGRPEADPRRVDGPAIVAAVLLGLMAIFLLASPDLAATYGMWRGLVFVAAMLAVAAWRAPALPLLHAAGAATVLAALRIALSGSFNVSIFGERLVVDGPSLLPNADTFVPVGALLGIAFLGAGFWRARTFLAEPRGVAWTAWAAIVPLVVAGALWFAFGDVHIDLRYAAVALLLAIALAAGGEWLARAEQPPHAGGAAVSVALGGAGFAALQAIHMGFDGGWTTVLLGAAAVLPALATQLRTYPVLGWLSTGAAVAVLVRAAIDPTIVGAAFLSTTPVFNWLLPGYGVPALAFAFAAWQLKRTTGGRPQLAMEAAAAVFSLLTVAMLVRHAMNGGVIDTSVPSLAEQAIYTLIALGFGGILIALDLRSPSPVLRFGSLAAGVVSMAMAVIQHFLVLNPLYTDESTGTLPVFDLLFLGYLLPAAAAGLLALYARGKRPKWYSAALALIGAALAFCYATFSVRRVFQGEFIALWRGMSQAETYTYSALWLVLGVMLLALGLFFRSYVLRVASAVLIVIAVAKVFLFDMSELEGVLRALSFIGLGAVLIGIGLFYQRMLVRTAKGEGVKP